MLCRSLIGGVAVVAIAAAAAILTMPVDRAKSADEAKYPNWKGAWNAINYRLQGQVIKFDPNKPWGVGQKAPLTPEYQKVLEASMADQAAGGQGNYPTARCLPGGMPRMMASPTQEYVITPETTYMLLGSEMRRVFTDGRPWPREGSVLPVYAGYSLGQWKDTDGDGVYDLLEVETRGPFEGPRAFDASGLPLAFDNESVFHEKFYIDKFDANLLHDEVTVVDHALTRPWTVDKTFRRNPNARPSYWGHNYCAEGNNQVVIGKENYFLDYEGNLMPAKKNQDPPDLKYFKKSAGK